MTTRVLVATRNRGKLAEFQRIFGDLGVELIGADALSLPDVEEDGETFEANATKKARELARASGLLTLGDDSGLEVDALGGAPGVLSARYAGTGGSEANVRKLLAALAGVPDDRRTARFRCVLAVTGGPLGERVELASGACEGWIARAPRGGGGFGYDPVFLPVGGTRTMSELEDSAKDALSHRGIACVAMRPRLAEALRTHARS